MTPAPIDRTDVFPYQKESTHMTRLAFVVALTLAAVVSSLTPAQAQTTEGLAIPVVSTGTAAAFNGTFTLRRFVRAGDSIAAVGTLSGVVTPTGGTPTSIFRNLIVPVQIAAGGPPVGADLVTPAATCGILHLDLGPLFLDLLGLQVDLSRVVLDIVAESGPGNLLGNLLCAVTGLLDQPGALTILLNRILGILG
jgi:hypothetical protein